MPDQNNSVNCGYYPYLSFVEWLSKSAAPGSSPKHTIYALIFYSQICAIFVLWKEPK